MHLQSLKLDGFRNLESQGLALSPHFNIFYGENGSGKTSLLESIYLLSSGRSFRSRIAKNYICFDRPSCTVFGEGQGLSIGIQKTAQGRTQAKINGKVIGSAQSLSTNLPCHVFFSGSFDLFEGGPTKRRGFFDWLVFHVKHQFRADWAEYNRCLKQRNSLLRRDKIDASEFSLWHETLATLGETISKARLSLLPAYLERVQHYSQQCGFDAEALDMTYYRGWDTESPLLTVLEAQLERDRLRGHTSAGPHKSDFVVKYHGRPIVDTLSRGQLKTLVAAMHMARIACFKEQMVDCPLVLVDDLPSELDRTNLEMTLEWFKQLGTQVLLTCVSVEDSLRSILEQQKNEIKVFHVKHGVITET